MRNPAVALLTTGRMAWVRHRRWRPFLRLTEDPRSAQDMLLRSILQQNRATDFGRQFRFGEIRNYAEYQSQVPVQTYEDLRPFIDRQEAEKRPCLTAEATEFYVLTSGTTSKPKYIPITERTIRQFRATQNIAAYAVYRGVPGAFRGRILGIVSPAIEGRLESGTPYGSMSGLIYKSMPRLLRSRYLVPPDVFELQDYQEKYYAIARYAIAEPDITLIATANPSTLLQLQRTIQDHCQELLADLGRRDSRRAGLLKELFDSKGQLLFSDLWPGLKVVTVWTGGSCGILLPTLRSWLPESTRVVEVGYMSSEFRGTLIVDVENNLEVPTLQYNFFEFVEQDRWEQGRPGFLTLDQLEEKRRYYVFATTQNGLYRYDINDIVEVTGFFNRTPAIRFVQKGKGVVSLTGEKLYENQLLQAVEALNSASGSNITFFIMLGSAEDLQYTLYLEHSPLDTEIIEQELRAMNLEFAAKRDSGRLEPIRTFFLKPGTGDRYRQHCLQAGQREGQFKMLHLQRQEDCHFDFFSHARE